MKRLLGGILLAMGILIAGASGLCSLFVLFQALFHGRSGNYIAQEVITVLVIGGAPFVIGLTLFFAGRSMIRSNDETGSADDN